MLDEQRKLFLKEMYRGMDNNTLRKEYKNREAIAENNDKGNYQLALDVLLEMIIERKLEIPK